MAALHAILHGLQMAGIMALEILLALILAFALSAIIQALVSKEEMSRLLPDDSPRTIALVCGLGAASSSCSYAAVALARSTFPKRSKLYRGDGISVCFHERRA
jgi:hypothetical protein